MAGKNGVARYFTIDDLKGYKRPERDFTKWGESTFRVQALYDQELARIREYAKIGENEYDGERDRDATVALGLTEPNLHVGPDQAALDEAILMVQHLPVGLRRDLSAAITQLSLGDPGSSYFKSFFERAGSLAKTEDMVPSTSSSAS